MTDRRRIQRFEVVEHLGTGGMGAVYRAHDPQLERDVAIKVLAEAAVATELSPDDTIDLRGNSPSTRDDLLREARMMAKLSHPNVLPVYEVGLAEGAVFVVMEHIAGQDLEAWLETERSTAEILDVFAQAGRGLAAAHASGIVHRDFKPANVLVGRDGRARVADFGLSKLVGRAPNAMVQVDDGRGTPRYMAPELWEGKPATTRSDVYAFCGALDRALGGGHMDTAQEREKRWRERGLSPRLRALLAAGFADEPEARPALTELLAALENRRRRPLWIYGAVACALAAGGVAAALLMQESKVSCDVDADRFAETWNDKKRAAFVAALAKQPASGAITLESITKRIDELVVTHLDELRATCVAVNEGKLGKVQAQHREWCVQRRALELGAIADRVIAAPRDLQRVRSLVYDVPKVVDCRELATTTAPTKPELYTRYIQSFELAIPSLSKEHEQALVALERDARAIGDLDLAARTAHHLGAELRFQDKYAEADEAAQRAYRDALELKWSGMTIVITMFRAKLAGEQNNVKQARDFAATAAALAEKATISDQMRARVYNEQGRAESRAGEHEKAVALFTKALDLAKTAKQFERDIELDIRFQLVNSLMGAPHGGPRAVEVAKETVEFTKQAYGENNGNFGVALNQLAGAYKAVFDFEASVALRRQALANQIATLPPENSHIHLQRSDLAGDLAAIGKLDEARTELVASLDAANKNEAVKPFRGVFRAQLGKTEFELGKLDEGQRLLDQGREETMEQFGRTHPITIEVRMWNLWMQLERQQWDAASHQLKLLLEAVAHDDKQTALVNGTYAALHALHAKRDLAGAEKLARGALEQLVEKRITDEQRASILWVIAEIELQQQRWQEAKSTAETVLAIARTNRWRADRLAAAELQLARAEVGLGIADGTARAERVRAELAKWPGQITARREVAALLGEPAPVQGGAKRPGGRDRRRVPAPRK